MEQCIEFSKQDKRFGVTIPDLTNPLLAFETGVHIGDGSLQIVPRGTHSTRFFGHKEDDWLFMSEVMPKVIKQLFNKEVKPTIDKNSNKCTLSVCSKAVATFKKNILGLPDGNKKSLSGLPKFVNINRKLLINCIQGIADTDFTLFFHKDEMGIHKHPEISCTMSNRKLIEDIVKNLKELGFNVKTKLNIKRTRKGKVNTEHRLTIFGKNQLLQWMNKVGFRNPHHLSKFLIWQCFGNCPKNTTTFERLSILTLFVSLDPK